MDDYERSRLAGRMRQELIESGVDAKDASDQQILDVMSHVGAAIMEFGMKFTDAILTLGTPKEDRRIAELESQVAELMREHRYNHNVRMEQNR
jgi:hypothetical protein